jgi:hypothetical protein
MIRIGMSIAILGVAMATSAALYMPTRGWEGYWGTMGVGCLGCALMVGGLLLVNWRRS